MIPAELNGNLLKELRGRTCRLLAREKWTQAQLGRALGVSQVMAGNYLAGMPTPLPDPTESDLQQAARRLAGALRDGAVREWALALLLDGEPLTIRLPSGGAREAVLADLVRVRKRLSPLLAHLSPEVRCNLACALPEAKAADGIAAFPGRLTPVAGKARPLAPAEFGASHHLAELLLLLRQRMPARKAIVNLRWDAVVEDALPRAGIRLARLVRKGERLELPGGGLAPALVDEGAIGWEPALYLHGDTLDEVATQVEALAVAAELAA